MHTFTNATVHIYEGDITFTDGIASRDEVTIYRTTRHPANGQIFFPEEIVHRESLTPLPLEDIGWKNDVLLPYSYTLRDACKLADMLANRYDCTFGVYNYEADDSTHYIVNTALAVVESIPCYYTAPNAMEGRIVRLPDGSLGWVHILMKINECRGYQVYHANLMYQDRVSALNYHFATDVTPLSRPPLPWDEDQIAFVATSEKEAIEGRASLYNLLSITFKITRQKNSWLLFP